MAKDNDQAGPEQGHPNGVATGYFETPKGAIHPGAPDAMPDDLPAMERYGVLVGLETAEPVLEDVWLLEDVLMNQGIVGLYGPPGSGKSVIALNMMIHIAEGLQWHGKDVERANVIYAPLEGTRMFSNRVKAACEMAGTEDATLESFATVNVGLDLRSKGGGGSNKDGKGLAEVVKEIVARTRLKNSVVVIDTLNRSFAGGNENSPEDMGALISTCGKLVQAAECLLILIHHSGKDVAQGMRGHSSLTGAVDTELKVERKDEGRVLTVSKQRDEEDGGEFGFLIDGVQVGETPKGKIVRAPYAKWALASDLQDAPKAAGVNQVKLMEALSQLTAEPGVKTNPSGVGWPEPGKFLIVPVKDLLNHAKGKLPPPEDGKADRRREHLKRALGIMTKKGVVQMNDGHVWKVGNSKI
ncbi:AAA family ATPase [Tateyamaria sp.]|uniref:AAA family ATPase n=1 Tax=Tateyamaria sp. TaxID=1929288 RepID=UPI00329A97D7